jgi:hypothetical protein
LIFTRYVREGRTFSRLPGAMDTATRLGNRLSGLLQNEAVERAVFLGRIGSGDAATSRSLRLPVERLISVE